MLAERWRVHYNTVKPHSSLGYRSPMEKRPGAVQRGHFREIEHTDNSDAEPVPPCVGTALPLSSCATHSHSKASPDHAL